MTQFLNGHGCFGYYLHGFRKVDVPVCVYCQAPVDDAQHTFFACNRWWRQIRELEVAINGQFTPESAVGKMLESSVNWLSMDTFVNVILSAREAEERERQRRP